MRYILMNRNSIDGLLTGVFSHLPFLYYKSAGEEGCHEMTNHMNEAKAFKFEEAARDYGQKVYGLASFNTHWMIVCVHDTAIHVNEQLYDRIAANTLKLQYEEAKAIRNKTRT